VLAILVFIIPKIGGAADLAIKIPKTDTEELYLRSVNQTVDSFRAVLDKLRAQSNAQIELANLDLDTGRGIRRGDYPLADKTYAELLERLTSRPGRRISESVKTNIIEYYASSDMAEDPGPQVNARLDLLRSMKTGEVQIGRMGASSFR
jgi:hypothetical protein